MSQTKTRSSMPDLSAPETAPQALQQDPVDPRLTLQLAQASLAAYYDYEQDPKHPVVPPVNYRTVARWTGWDPSIFGGQEERYGLVFQSTLPGGERTFIFAFRGTDSDMDAWEDLFADTVVFSPYRGTVSPTPYVSSGFYGIYDSVGSMRQSMRQQVFALLNSLQPRMVYITGHSLGGALSQLFALDMAVSTPQIRAANMNFASPMAGTANWQIAYESQPAQKDPATRTVRVYNYWDWVPSLPPSEFNYTHVGRGFRTSFYVLDAWLPYLLERHSLLNLQTVLQNAVFRNPQVWVGRFQDAVNPSLTMQSDVPPAGADIHWVDKMREFQQFEQSLREGGQNFPAALESMAMQEKTA